MDGKKMDTDINNKSDQPAAPLSGDTRIHLLIPGKEMTDSSAGLNPENYPPTAVLKVQGEHEYEIAKQVACGGMGVIYAARDRNCERWVAVKLMTGPLAGQARDVHRFIQEAK